MRDPICRVLQYVHAFLLVGGWGKGVVAYVSKEDLILNVMVGFTLMIFGSCGCLLEFQS